MTKYHVSGVGAGTNFRLPIWVPFLACASFYTSEKDISRTVHVVLVEDRGPTGIYEEKVVSHKRKPFQLWMIVDKRHQTFDDSVYNFSPRSGGLEIDTPAGCSSLQC